MNCGWGHVSKGSMSSDRRETLPCHPCNLLSTCPPLPLTRTVHRTLLYCTFPPRDTAVPLLCPAVTTWLISPLLRVQQPSRRGSAGHWPLCGERSAAHWYEVGKEHLGGSQAQKPPPPPHSTNKSFSWVITRGIMQMSWGKVQLHGHLHLRRNYFWMLGRQGLKDT